MKLALLDGFHLSDEDAAIDVPASAQRLLALIAIHDRPVARATIAGVLWPDASEAHALSSLRSVLNRLGDTARSVLVVNGTDLVLAPALGLDLREGKDVAHRLLRSDRLLSEQDGVEGSTSLLTRELLPGWYDEWLIEAARQWQDLRLRALEALTHRLVHARRFSNAAEAAAAAVAADPLRETSTAALMLVQLAEGNRAAAMRTLSTYRTLLMHELQAEPSPRLEAMLYAPPVGLDRPASVVFTARTAVAGEDVQAFEVAATGISMEPTIRHGDTPW